MKRIKKTKFFMFLATLVLLIGCVGCGNSNQVQNSGQDNGHQTEAPNTNTGKSDSAHVNLTDNEAKDILNKLLPKAIDIVAGMFNGTGFFKIDATKTIPGEKEYCLVTGENGKPVIGTNNVKHEIGKCQPFIVLKPSTYHDF